MDLLINGLFVIIGGAIGWLLQHMFPGRDARRLAESHERLATIEQARAEWEEKYRRLVGFTPRTQIVEYGPSSQSIIIKERPGSGLES
jgi:ribulose bisphosphate carboxylase small subunit